MDKKFLILGLLGLGAWLLSKKTKADTEQAAATATKKETSTKTQTSTVAEIGIWGDTQQNIDAANADPVAQHQLAADVAAQNIAFYEQLYAEGKVGLEAVVEAWQMSSQASSEIDTPVIAYDPSQAEAASEAVEDAVEAWDENNSYNQTAEESEAAEAAVYENLYDYAVDYGIDLSYYY